MKPLLLRGTHESKQQQQHIIQNVLCYSPQGRMGKHDQATPELDAMFLKCRLCIKNDCLQTTDRASDYIMNGFDECLKERSIPWMKFMILVALAWSKTFRAYCAERVPLRLRPGQAMVWSRLPKMLEAFAENKVIPFVKQRTAMTRDFVREVCIYLCRTA